MTLPKRKTDPPPPKPKMGRPPGEATKYTEKIYASVTPEQKRDLEMEAVQRRYDEGLSARWGVSDLIRELIEAHQAKRKPSKPAK